MIKVLDFMPWVSQQQPDARSGQEKSQLQPGEPAASSQQCSQCQEQPGGEPGAARRATARAARRASSSEEQSAASQQRLRAGEVIQ